MQAEEQEELSVEEKAKLFKQLLEQRRKHFAAKSVEEKRNKPPTQAQQRKIMCTYLKNMEGKKPKDLKNKSFDSIKKMFDRAFKRQKVDEDKDTSELQSLMEITPDEEEVTIDVVPLAVKSLSIVGWKIHKEGRKSYYQIMRADGKSQMYLVFSHMLKSFDREDLKTLYKLVKSKYKSTRPVEDMDLILWGDLKTMFEPHVEDTVWRNQQEYKVLDWKLYDSWGGRIVRIRSLLNAASITVALIDVNAAQSKAGVIWQRKDLNYALMALLIFSSDSEDIQVGEITIKELRKKLEKIQKEKDSIQFNVDKFENASNSLNKLIECQIIDNCKKGLGYEKYNAVPPPYTGNFMPPTPDLSYTGIDEFVNKPVVENRKSDEEVSKPKIEKKTVRPSIVKKEFVKSKQQEILLGKLLNKLRNLGKTLTVQEVAMLTVRVRKFIQKTGRNMDFKEKRPVSLDKSKIECYNCQRKGHFARECRSGRNQGRRSYGDNITVYEVELTSNDRSPKQMGFMLFPLHIKGELSNPKESDIYLSVYESVNRDKVIIEDWNSDDEDDVSEVQTVSPVKTNETQTVKTRVDKIGQTSQKQGIGFKKIKA
ncbi:retrovirus-related pol polyprotein from transposon TNT 1-94 [Tanacetum coccineum]